MTVDRDRRGRNVWWRRAFRMTRRGISSLAIPLFARVGLGLLGATWRIERIGAENYDAAWTHGSFLFALWHGDMLGPMPFHRGRGIGILVSPSGDGAIAKLVLQKFGYAVIRGSSNRGSARALREMRAYLDGDGPLVITPDGPRGPRQSMNLGLAWLARETGKPILPLHCEVDRAWSLRSWDQFKIPKPFAKIRVRYEPLVHVPADADDHDLERLTGDVRNAMLGATTCPD